MRSNDGDFVNGVAGDLTNGRRRCARLPFSFSFLFFFTREAPRRGAAVNL